ncbi:MAG: ribosome maturation factor [candidate division WOR-3 bacterium]
MELESIIERMAEEQGLVLVAVEQGPGFLRVFVDGDRGVSVEECAALSRRLERFLDKGYPIQGPYTLEVSSPGLDRELKTRREMVWAIGKRVRAVTRGGRVLSGRLISVSDEEINLEGEVLSVRDLARLNLAEVDT